MAFLSIFEYEDGMNILVDRKANLNIDIAQNLKNLSEDDLKAFKFIYEHELVTSRFVDIHKRKADFGDYNFKNHIKLYQECELLDSYYVKSPRGERSVDMFTLTEKAAAFIKERFELCERSMEIHEYIKTNNALDFLKKMALNQFLICSVDVKEYEIVKNEKYDAVIQYNDDPVKYYVKVVRSSDEEVSSIKDTVRYIDEELTGKRAMILLCEYTGFIVHLGSVLAGMRTNTELFYQTDVFALDFPESFLQVEVNGNEYVLTSIKRTLLDKFRHHI